MTDYLLDTNACIALLNGTPPTVRARFEAAVAGGSSVGVSAIAAYELSYGAAKSARRDQNEARLRKFFAGAEVVPFTDEDASVAGPIRAELETAGTPIGAYDVLIAGHAKRLGRVLVTSNAREFDRVRDLLSEDWARPAAVRAPKKASPRRTPRER